MSGEEFNADYRPLPQLSPGLFGGEPFGKGRWLYGSWIDWEQLKLPEKTQMLEDMKSIIKIRRSQSELIKPCRMGDTKRNFAADYLGCGLCIQIGRASCRERVSVRV